MSLDSDQSLKLPSKQDVTAIGVSLVSGNWRGRNITRLSLARCGIFTHVFKTKLRNNTIAVTTIVKYFACRSKIADINMQNLTEKGQLNNHFSGAYQTVECLSSSRKLKKLKLKAPVVCNDQLCLLFANRAMDTHSDFSELRFLSN